MTNESVIRAMTEADIPAAVALWRTTEGVGMNESDEPVPLALYLRRNPGLSLVAEIDRVMVAAVLCGHDGRRGSLNHLAVATGHRGQGIGRGMVERCLTALRELGITRCNIFLYTDNAEGEKFWRRMGWGHRTDLKVVQRSTS